MERGIIKTTPDNLLYAMGYNHTGQHLTPEKIVVDMFSNQVIIYVNGACDLYPVSIEPILERIAVTGL